MLDLDQHLAGDRLRIGKRLEHVADRPARDASLLERTQPMHRCSRAKVRGKLRLERFEVGHAAGIVAEPRILGELRGADRIEHAQPVAVVGAADDDPAVGRLERLIGRIERVRRAHRARGNAGRERDRRLPIGLHQRRFVERGLDPLTLAGLQAMRIGRENPHRGQNAGGNVGERRAALDRRPLRSLAGEAHDAGHRLGDQIEAAAMPVRSGAAEAGQRAIDQRRMLFPEILITEPQTFHDARREILDQHVGGLQQAAHHAGAAGLFEIDRHAALVAVHHQERRGLVPDLRRDHVAAVVAVRRLLDLDDVGAHVGEHERAGRPRHHVGEIDDFQTGQRTHWVLPFVCSHGRDHSPAHCGWRLFKNASMPSRKSRLM